VIRDWLDQTLAEAPGLPEDGLYDRLLAEF
jgi:hypothetical protein